MKLRDMTDEQLSREERIVDLELKQMEVKLLQNKVENTKPKISTMSFDLNNGMG